MADLLGFGREVEILAEYLDEGDFRRCPPRLAGMASPNL